MSSNEMRIFMISTIRSVVYLRSTFVNSYVAENWSLDNSEIGGTSDI